jgi:hypothetical protein
MVTETFLVQLTARPITKVRNLKAKTEADLKEIG